MSGNGESREVQQTVKCFNQECGKEFLVMLPHAEVINSLSLSQVIWVHPDVQSCPHCGIPYQMSVRKIQGVEVAWGPVKSRGAEAGIVVPPPGFRVPPIPGKN
jgi:hypothetical protein